MLVDNPRNGLGIGLHNPEENPVVFQVFYKLNGFPGPADFDFSTTKLVQPGQTGFALAASDGFGDIGYGFVGVQIYRLGTISTNSRCFVCVSVCVCVSVHLR